MIRDLCAPNNKVQIYYRRALLVRREFNRFNRAQYGGPTWLASLSWRAQALLAVSSSGGRSGFRNPLIQLLWEGFVGQTRIAFNPAEPRYNCTAWSGCRGSMPWRACRANTDSVVPGSHSEPGVLSPGIAAQHHSRTTEPRQAEPRHSRTAWSQPGILSHGKRSPGTAARHDHSPAFLSHGKPSPGTAARHDHSPASWATASRAPAQSHGMITARHPEPRQAKPRHSRTAWSQPGILSHGKPSPGTAARHDHSPASWAQLNNPASECRANVVDHGRDPEPQQDPSILASHGGAGLMVTNHGRDPGPQPDHSILQCHGSAGLVAECCGRDTYSGALSKGDIMCWEANNVISDWMDHSYTDTMLQNSCDPAFCNIVSLQLCSIQLEMTLFASQHKM